MSRSSQVRSAILALGFGLSLLAGSYHVATEPHDLPRSRAEARIVATPCHQAPGHSSHPSSDHECVLDEESDARDEALAPTLAVVEEPTAPASQDVTPAPRADRLPPPRDDALPALAQRPVTDSPRAPPAVS